MSKKEERIAEIQATLNLHPDTLLSASLVRQMVGRMPSGQGHATMHRIADILLDTIDEGDK